MKLLAGFGKRQLILAFCFSLVMELAHLTYAAIGDSAPRAAAGIIAAWMVLYFVFTVVGLACAVATDNLLGPRTAVARRLIVATLLATIVVAGLVEGVTYLWPAIEGKEPGVFLGMTHRIAYRLSLAGSWMLLLVGFYTMLQESRRANERLHGLKLGALATERRLVEADLRAMQARVEPDLLFAALPAIDRAYEQSVERGERALDALIAFLRAALPAEASATSTVAAELELVRAYVGLREIISAACPKLEIAADPAAASQPMPAMLLLPLVRRALDGGSTSISMGAQLRGRKLEVTLHGNGAQAASGEEITGLQARLAQLFAGRARLEAAPGFGARLEIPVGA
ncbi:MAG TPA: histidine kinase [Burkholderiales bacterium]